jgi:hypothetical protein
MLESQNNIIFSKIEINYKKLLQLHNITEKTNNSFILFMNNFLNNPKIYMLSQILSNKELSNYQKEEQIEYCLKDF